MEYQTNSQLHLAAEFVNSTNKHIFLTGKAGTGKTTFLHNLKNITFKRYVVVAPTGVAAINAGGVTIHSFFQLPFGPQIPADAAAPEFPEFEPPQTSAARFQRFNREKIDIIKSLDLLVIDEISMVRADLLDAIDCVLRRFRDRRQPFGGVQLLMIGDLQQLSPVAKEEEWQMLRPHYDSVYFFSSRSLQQTAYVSLELSHIYRQSDQRFIGLLNRVRENQLDDATLTSLNQRYLPDFPPDDQEGYITLTTHNYQAQQLNQSRLDQLTGNPRTFKAALRGDFPEIAYPTEEHLHLKIGAQVMFVKNDPEPDKKFFNGKIGRLVEIDRDILYVQCQDSPVPIAVTPLEWQNCRYGLNEQTHEIEETVLGTFTQYPLKLAWAITIHKSQGLTFEKAIIDAQAAFAHGQVYVALSRCKNLEGLVLSSPLLKQAVKSDAVVRRFVGQLAQNQPDEKGLQAAKAEFQLTLIAELFDFEPLRRQLGYLLKIMSENPAATEPQQRAHFEQLSTRLTTEVHAVAVKFMRQVTRMIATGPIVEENLELVERLRKAAAFFTPRIAALSQAASLTIETDNQDIHKRFDSLTAGMALNFRAKLACLEVLSKDFKVAAFLEARAKSSMEPGRARRTSSPDRNDPLPSDSDFYRLLKQWRRSLADEMNLPESSVLPLRAMKQIAAKMPADIDELQKIKGMGKKKIAQFGDQLLELVAYFAENGPESDARQNPADEPNAPQKSSDEISLEIYKSGKTIAEIAAERGYAASTIEKHLLPYILSGELKIEEFISLEKMLTITEYFMESEDARLAPAKEVLGDDYSYFELRLVMQHLTDKNLLAAFNPTSPSPQAG